MTMFPAAVVIHEKYLKGSGCDWPCNKCMKQSATDAFEYGNASNTSGAKALTTASERKKAFKNLSISMHYEKLGVVERFIGGPLYNLIKLLRFPLLIIFLPLTGLATWQVTKLAPPKNSDVTLWPEVGAQLGNYFTRLALMNDCTACSQKGSNFAVYAELDEREFLNSGTEGFIVVMVV